MCRNEKVEIPSTRKLQNKPLVNYVCFWLIFCWLTLDGEASEKYISEREKEDYMSKLKKKTLPPFNQRTRGLEADSISASTK
jgi:hypothetical protein